MLPVCADAELPLLLDRKGILGNVILGKIILSNWNMSGTRCVRNQMSLD